MKIFPLFLLLLVTTGCQQLQQLPLPKGTVGVTVTYTLADEDKPASAPVPESPKPVPESPKAE